MAARTRLSLALLVTVSTVLSAVSANVFGGVPVFDEHVISQDGGKRPKEPVEYDDYDAYDDLPTNSSSEEGERTIRLLKPLQNLTLTAGDTLKLRCEFTGDPPPNKFTWFRNEAPLERGEAQMRKAYKTRHGWRMRLRIGAVDTHDTGYYRCQASNGVHRAQSTAIVLVNRGEDGRQPSRHRDPLEGMDVPAFPPSKPIFDFPSLTPQIDSVPSEDGLGGLEGLLTGADGGSDQLVPVLDPSHWPKSPDNPRQLSGSCQPYRGAACARHLRNRTVFVADADTQARMEQRLVDALGLIEMFPDLSESCGDHAVQTVCLAAFPPCDASRQPARAQQICRDECELIKEYHCSKEYTEALKHPRIGLKIHLPICDDLPAVGSAEAADCVRLGLTRVVPVQPELTCYTEDGTGYAGTAQRAASGRLCRPWSEQMQYRTLAERQPALLGGHSFCRNWDNLETEPWCYTAGEQGGRERCAVPACSDPLIWYIVVPSVAFLALCIVVVLGCCFCRRVRSRATSPGYGLKQTAATAPVEMSALLPRQRAREIPIHKVRFLEELGEGAFGKVFRGEIVGYHGDGGVMPVAIKTLKEGAGQKTQHDFAREAELMTDLQHPNLVCLVGVVLRNTPRCMLFEHSSQGDLHEFLTLHSPRSDVSGCSSDGMMISVEQLMVIAIQVAAGMEFLASHHYVHRDLAARNCLVGDNLTVKISDLGLARDIYASDYYRVQSKALLPVRWMPVESIMYGKFTTESDVWSFGVLLWEIFSYGLQPFYGYTNAEVMEMVRCHRLLPCPEDCPSIIYALMVECWNETAHRRPTFSELHVRLRTWRAMPEVTAPHRSSAGGSQHSQHSSTGPSNNTASTSLSRQQQQVAPAHRQPPAPALFTRPSTPGSAVTVKHNDNWPIIPDSKISNV
ncbi:tyrosine-protein kinase transmembrane receptor ROR2-like isoform X2 [Amphibalanus amphitrite]|uniref:tyrosine-protein kinase transmembrane receptor ROR2-like isoform X2 n=1 Tax=Amphibalanus amphitrite TaxID=1232801 RepID=UPI001C925EC7|nr:tyrosine-protein kinase transmembrane receptor ROR2-like isoform X2 [Amphibalanus amphitrite]